MCLLLWHFMYKYRYFIVLICLLAVILLWLLFPICFDNNDDQTMIAIQSGMLSGGSNSHLILSNILIGKGLTFLSQKFTDVNWYTFYIEITLCVCFLSTTYLLITRKKTPLLPSVLVILILFFGFYSWAIIKPQFTTAALFCATLALLLYSLNIQKKIIFYLFSILMILSILIRKESWYIFVFFSFPYLILHFKSNTFYQIYWKSILISAIIFFALQWINNRDDKYREEQTYDNIYALDAIAAKPVKMDSLELMSYNFSVNDIRLLQSWMPIDNHYLTGKSMRVLAKQLKRHRNTSEVVMELKKIISDERYLFLMYALSLLAVIVIAPKSFKFSLLNLILLLILFSYLLLYSRLPHRVSFPILAYLTFSNLFLILEIENAVRKKYLFLLILTVLSFYKFYAVLNMAPLHKTYHAYYEDCRKEINQYPTALFIGAEAFPLGFMNVWKSQALSFPSKNLILAGWYPCSPDYNVVLAQHHLKNLTSSLYKNANVYFITEDVMLQDAYVKVMKERYKIQCHFEPSPVFVAIKAQKLVFDN